MITIVSGGSQKLHLRVMMAAFVCYVITAVYSAGYYHPDEHYQIIEFAGLKLGSNKAADLAWEYKAAIRSAFQPAICFVVFKFLGSIGIADPYVRAMALRILTAILAIGCISVFVNAMLPQIKSHYRNTYILLSYFLWFLPFLNVRFSSETWSGLFFLLAAGLLQIDNGKKRSLLIAAGIALGISFLCRFQSCLLIAGLLGWLIFVKKQPGRHVLLIGVTILSIVQLGLLLDYWFYGAYTYTFWRYFYVNSVLGTASGFGISPWYYYLPGIIAYAFWPFGVFILLSLLLMCVLRPRSILVWCIVPFLIVHSLIPHKEERFLFPLVNLTPALLIAGWQELMGFSVFNNPGRGIKKMAMALGVVFAGINIIGLLCASLKPVGIGRSGITRYIKDAYGKQPVYLVATPGANPFNPWPGLAGNFYGQSNVEEQNLKDQEDLFTTVFTGKGLNLLVVRKANLKDPWFSVHIKSLRFTEKARSMPRLIEKICMLYPGFQDDNILILYSMNDQ